MSRGLVSERMMISGRTEESPNAISNLPVVNPGQSPPRVKNWQLLESRLYLMSVSF